MRRRALAAALALALGVSALPVAGAAGAAAGAAAGGASAGAAAGRAMHTRLLRSEPADGEVLASPPERVRLVFSGPVEAGLSEAVLLHPAGDSLTLDARRDSADHALVVAVLPAGAVSRPGPYGLRWKVVAPDGHPVRGRFAFQVEGAGAAAGPEGEGVPGGVEGAAGGGEAAAGGAGAAPGADGDAPHLETEALAAPPWAVALRGVARAALLALAGSLVFLGWTRVPLSPGFRRATVRLSAAAALLLGLDLAAWAGGVAGADAQGMQAALATRPGLVGAARVALAALAVWAVALARRPGLAAGIALAAVLVDGASGHPAAIRPGLAIPLKSVHLVAASVWLGGLLVLLGGGEGADYRRRALAVSAAAVGAVAVVALTGIGETLLFLPRLADLVGSRYGWLVLGKASGLAALVGFGAYHRLVRIPRLAAAGGEGALRSSVRREVAVMLAVILLAAALAHVSPPEPGAVEALAGGAR